MDNYLLNWHVMVPRGTSMFALQFKRTFTLHREFVGITVFPTVFLEYLWRVKGDHTDPSSGATNRCYQVIPLSA